MATPHESFILFQLLDKKSPKTKDKLTSGKKNI